MIERSFILLERVGEETEKQIWKAGIDSWNKFIASEKIPAISFTRKAYYNRFLEKAKHALYSFDSSFFSRCLPKSHTWRLFEFFKDDAVYLDIETSGYYGDPTVVGLFDGIRTKIMVKGINLDAKKLKQELKRYKIIITFNGRSFDVPVLNRFYPDIIPDIPHIDLRFACQKLGLTGGLKNIEKELGIKRDYEVEGMCGKDAVLLWNLYRSTGNREYLSKLISYNEEDIINLKTIAEFVYKELKRRTIEYLN